MTTEPDSTEPDSTNPDATDPDEEMFSRQIDRRWHLDLDEHPPVWPNYIDNPQGGKE